MDRRKMLLIAAAVIAALGTLLVFLYVRSADNRADSRYKAVNVLRAVKQIDAGEKVADAQAAGKIQTGSVGEGEVIPGALTDLTTISNDVANTTIYPGEQIIASKFAATSSGTSLTIPKGKLALSVNLTDPARVAGFVNPGNEVAIFMNGTTANTFTRLLLPKVSVIGVGTTTVVSTTTTDSTGAQTTEQLPRTLITLSVSQDEAERILFAQKTGELSLALLNADSAVAPGPPITNQNLFR